MPAPATSNKRNTSMNKEASESTVDTAADRTVRFSNRRQVRVYQKYAKEEHPNVWYTMEELNERHCEDRREVRKYQFQMGMMGHESAEGRDLYSIRGLEHYHPGLSCNSMTANNNQGMMEYNKAVLEVYRLQVKMNRVNEEQLRQFAVAMSHNEVQRAKMTGKQDAMAVLARRPVKKLDIPSGSNSSSSKGKKFRMPRLAATAGSPNNAPRRQRQASPKRQQQQQRQASPSAGKRGSLRSSLTSLVKGKRSEIRKTVPACA